MIVIPSMRSVLLASVPAIALVAFPAHAQQDSGSGGRVEIQGGVPRSAALDAEFTPEMRAVDAVKAGEEALKRTAKAYRDAKNFRDEVSMRIAMQGRPDEMRFVIERDEQGAVYETDGMRVILSGGEVILTNPRAPKRFVAYRAEGGITRTLVRELGGFTLPLPTWLLEPAGSGDVVTELAGSVIPNPRLAGFDASKGRVLVVSDGPSKATFDIDPKTGFISGGRVQMSPVEDSDFTIELTLSMKPSTVPLKQKIGFSKEGKEQVEGLDGLQPQPIEVGAELPKVGFVAGDGLEFRIESLRGKVVVLSLWADWNQQSTRPLTHIDRFAKESKAAGRNIEVRGLCLMYGRDGEEADAVRRRSGEAWTKLKLEMPLLLARSEEVSSQWGVTDLPMTLVIGTDGKIAAIYRGLDPQAPWKIAEQLKESCEKALAPDRDE